MQKKDNLFHWESSRNKFSRAPSVIEKLKNCQNVEFPRVEKSLSHPLS